MRLLTGLLLTLSLAACSEPQTRYYASYADAHRAQLFEQGELPEVLPLSAKAFQVNTHADRKRATGRFKIAPADINTFASRLQQSPYPGYEFVYYHGAQVWLFNLHKDGKVEYRSHSK
ncbi:hypothetical protein CWC31_08240 [Pseudoalteromonas ruthenica]|uniref:hypothetical protein n=1 Tax=Pseudoalteromonas ruthenica TaxID=151081 RepID=UPI001108ED78|nr:hypothetical protein [Pseudoalteromonas ruthenica]TLX50965.1 hypothetical protein CWC31_08240 [Pseudoalteromonas ruthenica]